jgi:hypothetical protein
MFNKTLVVCTTCQPYLMRTSCADCCLLCSEVAFSITLFGFFDELFHPFFGGGGVVFVKVFTCTVNQECFNFVQLQF